VFLRVNDVLVGVVTGAICSVAAAIIEGTIAAARVFSFGHFGGGWLTKLLFVALVGAVAGGILGVVMSAFAKPRQAR
jgi:hypothetical protein